LRAWLFSLFEEREEGKVGEMIRQEEESEVSGYFENKRKRGEALSIVAADIVLLQYGG
jgi:hypothetical protein